MRLGQGGEEGGQRDMIKNQLQQSLEFQKNFLLEKISIQAKKVLKTEQNKSICEDFESRMS